MRKVRKKGEKQYMDLATYVFTTRVIQMIYNIYLYHLYSPGREDEVYTCIYRCIIYVCIYIYYIYTYIYIHIWPICHS